MIFLLGTPNGQAMAVRAGGQGDVSATHIVRQIPRGSNVGSPVYHDGHLYFVNDSRGTAYCLNAKTGDVVYESKISPARNRWYASPVLSVGRIYFVGRTSGTVVLAAKAQFDTLATNVIAGDTAVFNGSPAIANGQIILRSDRYAYCFSSRR